MASNPGFCVPVKTRLNVSGPQNLPQALYGDIVYRLVLSGDVALTTEKGDPAERQSIDYMTDLWDRDFDSTNWSFQSPKIDDYEEQEDISQKAPDVQAACERLFRWCPSLSRR